MADKDQNISDPVRLDCPVRRGETEIAEVQVRKPDSGALRGTNFHDLCKLDVAMLEKVLPRVIVPVLTQQEVAELDPADKLSLGTEIANFLLPKALRQDSPTA